MIANIIGTLFSPLCFFLVLLFLTTLPSHAQPTSMRVCIDDQLYIPYFDKDNSMRSDGKVIELVRRSAANNSLVIEIQRKSWARCLAKLIDNRVDAAMAVIYNAERADLMVFPKGAEQDKPALYLMRLRYPFFVKKDQPFRLSEYQRQAGHGISAPREYIAYQMLADMKLLSAYDYSLDNGLKMVAAGRLDAYVVEQASGQHALARLSLEQQVEAAGEALIDKYVHIPVSKQFYQAHQVQVDGFWQDLAAARTAVLAEH
ncbi:substrate-binding periplasmic protein [Thalassotalea euphylliae]|nr:transporter substrate-binding domain-containing protein [Thalassotalea euphylliae]